MSDHRAHGTSRVLCPLILALTAASIAHAQQFQEQTTTRFPSPNPSDYTNYIDVVDLEGDGDLDLIFANGGNFSSAGGAQPVRVFVNDGSAVFTDESAARVGISGNFRGVVTGDVDDDGDEDMLLSSDFNRQPLLLMNNGAGVFTDDTAARLPVITLSSTRGQFADIDDDGDLDIYINNGGTNNRFGCGANRIFINDGTGVFTDETASRHPAGNVCQPMDVIFGDVDNDLDLDVRTGNRGNNSKLYLNDGAGVFTDASTGAPADSSTYSYDFAYLNGDGNLDMLGANSGPSNREQLAFGNGDGTFTDNSSLISPNTTGDDNDSKFFDLDADGDLDLIIASLFQTREKVYVNTAGTLTLDGTIITNANDATLDVAVADFDSDGDFDIVTAQGESGASFQNRIYINTTKTSDTLPPVVRQFTDLPDTEDTDGPYVVRATITDHITSDRGFFDKGITLLWSADGGDDTETEMTWVGNSMWRAEIPGQAGGSTIAYHVRAVDWNNNVGTSATREFVILGGSLPGDVDGDGDVDFEDLVALLAKWGPCPGCPSDFDGDDMVGFTDLVIVLGNWS